MRGTATRRRILENGTVHVESVVTRSMVRGLIIDDLGDVFRARTRRHGGALRAVNRCLALGAGRRAGSGCSSAC
jgi:hypothetical protein